MTRRSEVLPTPIVKIKWSETWTRMRERKDRWCKGRDFKMKYKILIIMIKTVVGHQNVTMVCHWHVVIFSFLIFNVICRLIEKCLRCWFLFFHFHNVFSFLHRSNIQNLEGHPFTDDWILIWFFFSLSFGVVWYLRFDIANIYIIGWMLIVFLSKREDTLLCIPFKMRVIICQFVRTMDTGHRRDMHDLNIHLKFHFISSFFIGSVSLKHFICSTRVSFEMKRGKKKKLKNVSSFQTLDLKGSSNHIFSLHTHANNCWSICCFCFWDDEEGFVN